MSDFLDDAPPPKPVPAIKPVIDPFAGEAVKAPAPDAAAAPAQSGTGRIVRPGAPRPPTVAAPKAGAADPFADVDLDAAARRPDRDDSAVAKMNEETDRILKGGAGKELWQCKHCGAKNKPTRTECRSCGKSKDSSLPIWKKKWFPVAVGGAVVALIAIVVLAMPGTDFSQAPPRMDRIDRQLRIDHGGGESQRCNGFSFKPAGRIALCGRVMQADKLSGACPGWKIHVAYGDPKQVADEEIWPQLRVQDLTTGIDILLGDKPAPGEAFGIALLHIYDEHGALRDDPAPGMVLTFSGVHGQAAEWEWTHQVRKNEYHVLPTGGVRVAQP